MKKVILADQSRRSYSLIEGRIDLNSFPLMGSILGMNNCICVNLGSNDISKEMAIAYKKAGLRPDEIDEYTIASCVYKLRLVTRTHDDKYEYHYFDFRQLYNWIVENAWFDVDKNETYTQVWLQMVDESVQLVPLGCDAFTNAANYAYQEIESIKMDNFMNNFSKSKYVKAFLNILSY